MKTQTLIAFAALALLAACSNQDQSQRALVGAGYTDIHFTGYRFTGCSKDDTYSDGFEAKGPTGHKVTGVVCAGMLFKGATIRVD